MKVVCYLDLAADDGTGYAQVCGPLLWPDEIIDDLCEAFGLDCSDDNLVAAVRAHLENPSDG